MARIIDKGDKWELEIFPEAQPVEIIDELSTKGYTAQLGYDNTSERHVVMYVWYDKDRYPIGDVLKKIDDMINCARCDTLDRERLKNVSIESAERPEPRRRLIHTPGSHPDMDSFDAGVSSPPGRPAFIKDTPAARTTNVKDMFTNAMFDAYLTPAGKLLMGNVFGDESLTEEAFPKTPQEMAQLWDDTTAGKFLRNPEEAKEFISVMKDGDEGEGSNSPNSKKVKKITHGIVIY